MLDNRLGAVLTACMPEPRPVTVTFLFRDIEGSTRLVRELRGRYPEIPLSSGVFSRPPDCEASHIQAVALRTEL